MVIAEQIRLGEKFIRISLLRVSELSMYLLLLRSMNIITVTCYDTSSLPLYLKQSDCACGV